MATPTKLDTKLVPKVAALLTSLGKTVTIERATSSYDVDSGKTTKTPVALVSVKASPPAPFAKKMVDGELVQIGDLMTIIAASGLTWKPRIGWRFFLDSDTAIGPKTLSVSGSVITGVAGDFDDVAVNDTIRWQDGSADPEYFRVTAVAGDGSTVTVATAPTETGGSGDETVTPTAGFKILRVDELYSGEQVAAYELHLRR